MAVCHLAFAKPDRLESAPFWPLEFDDLTVNLNKGTCVSDNHISIGIVSFCIISNLRVLCTFE